MKVPESFVWASSSDTGLSNRIVLACDAEVPMNGPAVKYGLAGFEGLCVTHPEPNVALVFCPADHFRRFNETARALGVTLPCTIPDMMEGLDDVLRQHPAANYVDPVLGIVGDKAGVDPTGSPVRVVIRATDGWTPQRPYHDCGRHNGGISVLISECRRSTEYDGFPGVKASCGYTKPAVTKAAARVSHGVSDIIVRAPDGDHMAELSGAHLICILPDGSFVTPDASANVLKNGVTLKTLRVLVRELYQTNIVERPISLSELCSMREIIACGTAVRVEAVTKINKWGVGQGEWYGRPGPIATLLRQAYHEVIHGAGLCQTGWCHKVDLVI